MHGSFHRLSFHENKLQRCEREPQLQKSLLAEEFEINIFAAEISA